MKPFRKNVAIAIDGGGIRGLIVTRALSRLEGVLGLPARAVFRLAVGTSTGSIISAGIGAGLSAARLHELYASLGGSIFRKSLRSKLWLIFKHRYDPLPLEAALREHIGPLTMGELWEASHSDVLITTFDLVENRTRFIKSLKPEYAAWPVVKAIMASSSVPTFFPPVEARYVDGGIGAYANPSYLAAFEAKFVLGWDLRETTLISLGTGHYPGGLKEGQAAHFYAWDWLGPIFNAFMHSADDQQVHLVDALFEGLDFRRFQVPLREDIAMDAAERIPELITYGDEMWRRIDADEIERPPDFRALKKA